VTRQGQPPLAICHFHPCLTGSGGDRVSEAELRYCIGQGHRGSYLLAYEPCGYEPAFDALGCARHVMNGRDLSVRECGQSGEELFPAALSFLRSQGANLLHCHNAAIVPQAVLLARSANIPLVITAHIMGDKWERWRWSHKPRRRRQFRLIRQGFESAAAVLAVSRTVAEHAQRVLELSGTNLQVMQPSVNEVFFDQSAPVGMDFDVAITGRPTKSKGVPFIGRTLERLLTVRPNIRIVWVGASGDEELVRASVRRPELRTAIHFLGPLTPSQVCCVLRRSRVLFHPTRREGCALVVSEAALCGSRLVLSDIPVLRELYDLPGTWFFHPNRPADAVRALLAAVEEPGGRRSPDQLRLPNEAEHGEAVLEVYRRALTG